MPVVPKGAVSAPGTVPGHVLLKLKWGYVQFSLKNLAMGPVKLEDITAVAVSQSLRVPLLGSFLTSGILISLQRHGKMAASHHPGLSSAISAN